ncbi:MAG TPA: alpha-amylase family protein [Alphaproteobacteria bacterium]|nr:alpha-amylase family protein [Alphaproteobacteria bacterium]
MIDLWYKNALVYCLDVETFQDGNDDGVGDFAGLTRRLDHIAALGATCIWLLPFQPSPNHDNGYDVSDYYGVDPRLGTLGDFVEFTHQSRDRGIRVLIDLVVNHTSDQHPWFQAARRDPESPYKDYYVWSKERPEDADEGIVFPGVQESTWSWDDAVGAYYFHRFFDHQPDLNISNAAVREEIQRIMGFWLQLGVSGFRIDAAPFLIGQPHGEANPPQDPHRYLNEMRDFLSWRRGDAVLLAEANVPMNEIGPFFGDGDRMHMLFNFLACETLFLGLARREATPLVRGLRSLPEKPDKCQWASFVRNHDELNLSRLPDEEREEVYQAFAPDPDMRLYDRGIRRRLPPMVDGDRRCMELAYAVMLSLPGTPVLRYGEEIGMGENLSLPDRQAVRTPMQWSDDTNGGFSQAPVDRLVVPATADGRFGYRQVNVTAQQRDSSSFLLWMQRAVQARRSCPEFGWGDFRILQVDDGAVMAHRCTWRGKTVLAVHNFADSEREAKLPLRRDEARQLLEHFCDSDYDQPGEDGTVRLRPYGYRWFRLGAAPHR